MMGILQFEAIYQERVWGGRALAESFGRTLPPDGVIGESWEIVDRPEAQSMVRGGPRCRPVVARIDRDPRPRDHGPGLAAGQGVSHSGEVARLSRTAQPAGASAGGPGAGPGRRAEDGKLVHRQGRAGRGAHRGLAAGREPRAVRAGAGRGHAGDVREPVRGGRRRFRPREKRHGARHRRRQSHPRNPAEFRHDLPGV